MEIHCGRQKNCTFIRLNTSLDIYSTWLLVPSLSDFVFLGDPKLESRDEVHVLRFVERFFCPKRDSCIYRRWRSRSPTEMLTELQNFCALLAGRQFCLNRKALLYLRPCAVWLLNRTIKNYGGKPEFVKSLATASTKNWPTQKYCQVNLSPQRSGN